MLNRDYKNVQFNRQPLSMEKNIPRFVQSETYSKSFGDQWMHFQKTQLDSYTGSPISRDRLINCLGPELWKNLARQRVLDCGCGAGRFTEILISQGASVVSVDLSRAVEVNASQFPPDAQHEVIQADLLDLPFAKEQFDIVLCLGVLQHTPNPAMTVQRLADQVKPGGYLVIDQYRFTKSYLSLRLLYRQFFRRLPPTRALGILQRLGRFFLPLHSGARHSRALSFMLNRFSPFITYYRALPQLNDQLQSEWALLDTMDTLTDWHKNFGSLKKMGQFLNSAGLQVIFCRHGGNGIEALAKKKSP